MDMSDIVITHPDGGVEITIVTKKPHFPIQEEIATEVVLNHQKVEGAHWVKETVVLSLQLRVVSVSSFFSCSCFSPSQSHLKLMSNSL